ncbi:hypothetical protein FUAX_47130 (plasmid) [Fulvitalea axinellae]|uniref:Uncharacterized protein n=1 Tax=Fulvitalea axinellae TaxID=1182444 RepID=A0AAU9DGN3_9BACT|nr:hypothetical protein FUAX_47130 [Fulvitalea axinellae]
MLESNHSTRHLREYINFSTLCLSLLFLTTLSASGQDLISGLGGLNTKFEIYKDSVDLKPISQFIIKRGYADTYNNTSSENGSYGYGYGTEYLHFEFLVHTKKKLGTKKKWKLFKATSSTERVSEFYKIYLYDENDELLADFPIKRFHVTKSSKYQSYETHLNRLPLSYFLLAKKIVLK